jgi:hypothetical protein
MVTPATSTTSAVERDGQPVGTAVVRWDTLPGRVKIQLDPAAAAAIGWPEHVTIEPSDRVLIVTPCSAGARGARETWRGKAGLSFTARLSVQRRELGRWPAWADGAGLVLDLAGQDLARSAA